ncbi:MAG TPA: DUF2459 domain-containing protein [Stellaceae bacterium]|nr:DUF2459 domain-containing protein [Stellaceae bacterium]
MGRRRFRPRAALLVLLLLAAAVSGCASSPVAPYRGDAPRQETLFVIAGGWHTEIGIPAEAMPAALAEMRRAAPEARYFVFGWGQRDYYMAPHPGLGDLLGAGFPGPSVLLVIPVPEEPTAYFAGDARVFALPVSAPGLARLSQFLGGYVALDAQRRPRPLGDGPDRGSRFYASSGTYSLGNTCNTWTAEALHVAGLPVSASGVVFASGVTEQIK